MGTSCSKNPDSTVLRAEQWDFSSFELLLLFSLHHYYRVFRAVVGLLGLLPKWQRFNSQLAAYMG